MIMVITGKAWKYGDDVNTDVIFPGKYTYTLTDPAEIAAHALEDLDPSFVTHSREQAATCLKWAGVGAVVAVSFARIFYRNAINNGLPAIVCPEAVTALQSGQRLTIDLSGAKINCLGGVFSFDPFPPSVQQILADGGLIPHLRSIL
jgi:3-isopropylmalate/(R)-2-methylmalate dehydratase small subunit